MTADRRPHVNLPTRIAQWWRVSRAAQVATFVVADVIIILASTVLAFFARFEGAIPVDFIRIIAPTALSASLLFPMLFLVFGLYGYIWRYVGVPALVRLGWVTAMGMLVILIMDLLLTGPPLGRPIPLGTLLIFGVMAFTGFLGVRVFGRLIAYVQASQPIGDPRRVLVIGAGRAGSLLIRDIESSRELGLKVVGLVDDDTAKMGLSLGRARVLGNVDDIPRLVLENDVDAVFVAMPGAPPSSLRRVLAICGRTGLPLKLVPSLAAGRSSVGVPDLQDVRLEDLVDRTPVEVDIAAVRERINGRRVLVTGAAGSIGSELCRQIAAFEPSRLTLVEMDESRLYETFLEIREICGSAAWMSLTDVRSKQKLLSVFQHERPDIVIHAAAYKHVPLMEYEPAEAIKANVLGTQNVIQACEESGVSDFTLISTDKAVTPSTVMGATKRLAEKLSIEVASRGMSVTIVRFGNVLGSRGSVVPLFEQAMRRGDSIRITHPDVTRYFMSISEAVQLVLEAGTLTLGADIFVLEMGEPVRVLDIAQTIIQMAGGGADVEFSGLRPAEKMHEVLVSAEEQLIPTDCEGVLRLSALPIQHPEMLDVEPLVRLALADAEGAAIRRELGLLLPEYTVETGADV